MNILDREVHFGKRRTVSLYVYWVIFGTVLLSGLAISYIDESVAAGMIGGPLALMILPPFKKPDQQSPSWKHMVKVALLAGALTGVIAFST